MSRDDLLDDLEAAVGAWLSHTPGLRPPLRGVLRRAVRHHEARELKRQLDLMGLPPEDGS